MNFLNRSTSFFYFILFCLGNFISYFATDLVNIFQRIYSFFSLAFKIMEFFNYYIDFVVEI